MSATAPRLPFLDALRGYAILGVMWVHVEQVAPIFAARNVETPDGHVLLLWVYLDHEKVEYEFDSGDDEADENDNE